MPSKSPAALTALIFVAALSTCLSACVTINIYFPAAAAEKAADKIIDEVWQTQQGAQPDKPAAPAVTPPSGK